jgi:hypothetical protein
MTLSPCGEMRVAREHPGQTKGALDRSRTCARVMAALLPPRRPHPFPRLTQGPSPVGIGVLVRRARRHRKAPRSIEGARCPRSAPAIAGSRRRWRESPRRRRRRCTRADAARASRRRPPAPPASRPATRRAARAFFSDGPPKPVSGFGFPDGLLPVMRLKRERASLLSRSTATLVIQRKRLIFSAFMPQVRVRRGPPSPVSRG